MRAVLIATLLLCINVGIAIIAYANGVSPLIIGTQLNEQPALISSVQSRINQNYTQQSVLEQSDSRLSIGDYLAALVWFGKLVGLLLFAIPWLLVTQAHVPTTIGVLAGVPMLFIYGIAIIQIMRGGGDLES
jgi:hypothetical protein